MARNTPRSGAADGHVDMSVATTIESFLTWLRVERGRADNTVASYRRDLLKAAEWLRRRGVSLPDAAGPDLEVFVSELQRSGEAAKSSARRLAALRMYFGHRVAEGLRDSDPTSLLEGIRVATGVPKPLTRNEVDRLLDAMTGESAAEVRDRALVEFLYATGARISEACGLDIDDIDFAGGVVRLFGKGSKERIVPVGGCAVAALREYINDGARRALAPSAWRTGTDRTAVFLTDTGRRLNRQKAWLVVRSAGSRAGIDRELSPHVLRHTCATLMLENGADLRIVQEMLGHASISTTQVYTKVTQERLFAVYEAAHPRAKLPAGKKAET